MPAPHTEPSFRVWNAENVISSPMNLPALADLATAGRIAPESWVFTEPDRQWKQASAIPELNVVFGSHQRARNTIVLRAKEMGVTPELLRRVKILSQMSDNQLERFIEFAELQPVDMSGSVVTRGSNGDAMYLVMDGELRARLLVDGKESLLATFGPGDFFGETSLLDHGPRSADVIASYQSLLIKLTAAAFDQMRKEAPDVALELLLNISRSLVIRMRMLNKRHEDSLHMWQSLPQ